MSRDESRHYYNEFATHYEDHRHHGYHRWLDERSVALVREQARGRRVLEVGCGTGLILREIAPVAAEAVGLDLSPGMLEVARQRQLSVVEGSADELPFGDANFDLVYSFKVLAHVPSIGQALSEMVRVTRPGGQLVLEFYNRRSLRYLIRRLRPQGRIGSAMTEADVFTRFDDIGDLEALIPRDARLEEVRGLRVATVLPQFFKVPGWARVEDALSRSPLRHYAGFLVLVLRKDG